MNVAGGCRPVNGAEWVAACFFVALGAWQASKSLGRYLCEMEGLLAFELACQPYVCLMGDGLWAR